MSIADALTELSNLLGNRLLRSKAELEAHGGSEAHFRPVLPDAVAYPATSQEVSELARICSAHGCPMTGWGAGTSLEGHALAVQGGVVVDFSQMNRLVAVSAADLDARVQPGLTRQELNEALKREGLFFPVDPGANASIGGMAATRASGTTAVRYGTMRDNVLGLEVVLADGRLIRTGTRARKSSAGYDLTALLVGSEGTLGLVTELTLRLQGLPEATAAAVCAFATFEGAVDAVIETIQMGIPMARIEFIDDATVRAFNAADGAQMPEQPHLMVEFHGSDGGVAEQAARFGEIAAEHGGSGFRWSVHAEERTALWRMRHNAAWSIVRMRPGSKMFVTDVCVPISALAEAVAAAQADIAASPLDGPILGHVGDGNFHAVLPVDPESRSEIAEARRLAGRMAETALRLGGTVTGEHGIGFGKLDYMETEHGPAWAVMGQIKRALDPANLMNPGKMVRLN